MLEGRLRLMACELSPSTFLRFYFYLSASVSDKLFAVSRSRAELAVNFLRSKARNGFKMAATEFRHSIECLHLAMSKEITRAKIIQTCGNRYESVRKMHLFLFQTRR